MTPADWRALAERFEAADETTEYECVDALVALAPLDRDKRAKLRGAILNARLAPVPDLLLGVVVACVPEGWTWQGSTDYPAGDGRAIARFGMRRTEPAGDTPYGPTVRLTHEPVIGEANTAIAALGAAVCRAWAEVAGGKEVAG